MGSVRDTKDMRYSNLSLGFIAHLGPRGRVGGLPRTGDKGQGPSGRYARLSIFIYSPFSLLLHPREIDLVCEA